MRNRPDIRTFAGANWTGYAYGGPNRTAYVRRAEAQPVTAARRAAGASRFQTRGSLRVVKIGSVCPECWQTYRPAGGCGCD